MPAPSGPTDEAPADDAESTAPLDDPISMHTAVDAEQVRRVLHRLATEPLRLRPDNLVARPWGGRRLLALKRLRPERGQASLKIGESFEVAADPDDPEASRYPSIVEFDDGSSMRLTELLARAGEAVLGPAMFAAVGPRLPLLPKLLDVQRLLSVQSHPPGNPELYVVVDCEPGASLRLGFGRDVDSGALAEQLTAARADQDALVELLWVPEHRLGQVCADLFGRDDAVARLAQRFAPLLRDPAELPRLRALLERLDACYRETLARLNRIELTPGMVVFNASPAGPIHAVAPSAEIHALGNPEGKSALVLEIRRPGVTYRAWDHVRFPRRELAVAEALAAASSRASRPEEFVVEPRPVPGRPGVARLVECPAFVVDRLQPVPGAAIELRGDGRPSTLHAIAGEVGLRGADGRDFGRLRAGESLLLPARLAPLQLEAEGSEATLIHAIVPVPPADPQPFASVQPSLDPRADADTARRANLATMRRLVAESRGPRELIAVVNPSDGSRVRARLREQVPAIFRADGATRIVAHEEHSRRGQLLGLLDALRSRRREHGPLDPTCVALGIMLPGKGTRLSPLTQRLDGIKPAFPVPVRAGAGEGAASIWLDAAAASLWSWSLVADTLARQGFAGVAWKWGDEPQIPATELAAFDVDLSDVDAVRFGAAAEITEDLARNKEWLVVDPATSELRVQLRRRDRARLLQRIGAAGIAHVHIGSPAFSHRFLRHAEAVFGKLDGWLDVDGYLFEALTQDPSVWAEEIAGDREAEALLSRCPDFYARARELRRRIEAERGHPLRIVVVDFGADPYWADVGQLDKARAVWSALRGRDEHGAFARELAGIEVEPDRHGNFVIGEARIPTDGSVRDSVIVDARIDRGLVRGAVVVRSTIGTAGLEPGAVVLDAAVAALRMGRDSLAFASVGEYLRIPAHHVHTSIAREPGGALESWLADARDNPGAPANYELPRYGNPTSFAAKLEQVRAWAAARDDDA